ncbi:anthranilate synthase component I family protein [Paramicrobacterium agarici]|uniref:Anthranilate synthase component 1/para-aminobenzoate synthetase n=1 Tax=Paramicrobacterium agarici TaxID=630514 RepID=A0A2A9DZ31_9MICO|nr:anthranilate synthase component I family protein [Microbacterium agarici]PFG31189.1 anthranilate synthase component 1/para-aminobenzoate synthetase [Microbacterium agarici]
MSSSFRRIDVSATSAAVAFDVLVGDDAHGFWLTTRSSGRTVSRIGIGEPVSAGVLPVSDSPRRGDATGENWIGWAGYDQSASIWLRAVRYVTVDHSSGLLWAHAPQDEVDAWCDEVRRRVMSLPIRRTRGRADSTDVVAVARHSPDEYRDMIATALDSIRSGDAYQLCLTTRFTVHDSLDPRLVHARLSQANAPYTALIRSDDRALVAASPEQFLRLTASGRVSTSPIKGTRPRESDPALDAQRGLELVSDAKERSENLMIVDLMRNDLSRVCTADSVAVARLFELESHAHVHQLVSQVTGRMREDCTIDDLIDAAFPAGSMTGAPKQRAMQILAGLERGPRGVYAGCFGWLGERGDAELAMTIRSAVFEGDIAYVGAGGGLTIDSRPEFEIDEVAVKAQAPLAALGARLPRPWESRGHDW